MLYTYITDGYASTVMHTIEIIWFITLLVPILQYWCQYNTDRP